MKRIFKLFPVALTAFALASCSSDDLTSTNEAKELQFEEGKLYVQVDDDENVTRAGYTELIADYSQIVAMSFQKGDQFKVYHDAANWRPQIWEWKQTADVQYKGSTGFDVFEKTDDDTDISQYSVAYGCYPANLVQFGNENRTSLAYDMTSFKLLNYATNSAQTFDYNGTEYKNGDKDANGNDVTVTRYTSPMPLWGRKTENSDVMKATAMTGRLRVDISNVTAATGTNKKYLIIKSNTHKMWGTFKSANDLLNPTPAEALDPAKFITAEGVPTLTLPNATATWTATAVPVRAANIWDNTIVVDLGKNGGHVLVYVPVSVGATATTTIPAYEVYLSNAVASTATTVDVSAATAKIGELTFDDINKVNGANDGEIKANKLYKIEIDGGINVNDVNTPFELAKAIIAKDKTMYRDFTMNINGGTTAVFVKNDDTAPQNYVLDLSNTTPEYGLDDYPDGWELKHNVTVNVKVDRQGSAATNLQVKTKGGKKLTINFLTGSSLEKVTFASNSLNSDVVLDGAVPSVDNATSGKLTIAGNVTTKVTTSGELTIDAKGNTVADLEIQKGCEKINVLDGDVTKVEFTPTTTTNNKAIAADVEFHTEGTGNLVEVDYKNVPLASGNKTFKYAVNYTSKWDGTATKTTPTTITWTGGNVKGIDVLGTSLENVASAITSAAQLNGYAATVATRILVKEIDLDGNNLQNATPLAAAVNGNYNVYPNATDANTAKATIAQANIKNLQIGAAATALSTDNYGLFKTSTTGAEVYNLKISDAKVLGTTGNILANVGTLIGKATADVKVKNVDVTGLNVTITGATDYTTTTNDLNIGGVIGQVTGGTATMHDVTTAGAISANGTLGGIIGNVADATSSKAVFGTYKTSGTGSSTKYTADQVCSSTITMTVTPGQAEYDPLYAMVGTLVGTSYLNGAGVEIYTKTALTPTIAVPEKAKASRMTANFAILRYNIERGLDEVGFSGLTAVTTAMTNWKVNVYVYDNTPAASATAKEYVAKAYNIAAPHTTGWTIANYAAKTTPEFCAWNISTQYVTE